ncbi:MAG: hypothetical protein H6686_03590 [Fibrobacteria bacterium]|nr:hypothetical protein [Fibrobacteria bacterium]
MGTIADTVLFNGTRRIGYGWDAPDSTDGMDRAAILARGGGGGVGFGSWADSGVDLRLLRFGSGVGRSSGTQVLNSPSGPIVIGSFEADSPGVLFEGVDSFAFPRGASCFAFHANGGTGGKWFVSAACRPFASPTAVLAGDHLWLVANDSFPGPASTVGPLDSRGVRPGLARIHSETGRMEFRYFPFDSMQGAIGSIAGDDAGNLLLQGDQSSEFVFGGVALAPIPDTVQGGEDLAVVTTGWLALLDSAGHLRRFRQLHGIENMGGWKVRHVPGAGWVALAWDRWDLVGWARLYLFDDDLVLLDSSPRLPSAFDMEIGSDGEILLTGAVREGQLLPSWLRGEGSMWVASCRFGAPAGVSPFGGGVGMPRLVQRGDHLVGVGDLRDEMLVKGFDLLGNRIFQGPLARGARVALPRGTSIWVVEHPGARTVLRATLP